MQNNIKESNQEQLLKKITSVLEKANVAYMITGALSVIFYGRPRASHDIDFVIEINNNELEKAKKTFALLSNEFLIDQKEIESAILQKKYFNILHLPTMLKIDFWLLKDESFDKERFKRRKRIKVFGQNMTFASPEDTILIKLVWYKDTKIEKHLIDAAFVRQIQKENLDEKYLFSWSKKQKTLELLKELDKIDLEQYY